MKFSNWPQGSEEWFAERRGVITASKLRDALDRFEDTQPKEAVYYVKEPDRVRFPAVEYKRGELKAAGRLYAMDTARERLGGLVFGQYQNQQMRYGSEQEPFAREAYERERGVLVEEVGFFKTDDGRFGLSVDGLVEDDGAIEIKVLASSDQLFQLLVDKDYRDFIHQITAPHWLLARKWTDLVLWTPDLEKKMHVVRFERDESFIEQMEAGLLEFEAHVSCLEGRLRAAI
jgi:exodeoxyribonuclease (lambda-induced)